MGKFKLLFLLAILISIMFVGCEQQKPIKQQTETSERQSRTDNEDNTKPQKPQSFSGNGDKVQMINLSKGLLIIEAEYSGYSNFIITIKKSDGKLVGSPINIISEGHYSGSQSETIETDGLYAFNVQSSGKWTFNIK